MTKRNAVLTCALLVGAIVVAFLLPYRAWLYEGPGNLRDSGFLSYPRYQLEFPQIARDDSRHTYTFTGVPSEEMTLMLYVVGSSLDDFDALEKAPVQITAQLFEDATGTTPRRTVCEATGSPAGREKGARWIVTRGPYDAAFWHPRCLRMPLSSQRAYTLHLEITSTDPSSLRKALVPTLEGGGIELP
jgi:hypothetical protein